MTAIEMARQQVVQAAQDLTRKGYLMATGGNLSVRVPGGKVFAVTPSNYDYMEMLPKDVCILAPDGTQVEGLLPPSVESSMHLAIYHTRPDVNAIVHTHQVYASALTLMRLSIPALFDEQARFLGRSVEIIPYAPSGTGFLRDVVAKHVKNKNNAFLMQNHGALLLGHDLERAVHNVEILEKCSLAYLLTLCSGNKATRIPLPVREIAFAKLRKDQKKVERGSSDLGGE